MNPGAYADRGSVYITYQKIASCALKYAYGKGYFEHSYAGCNCTWSVSINIGAMNIGYSQTDPPDEELQKSTSPISRQV
jgi:hypothetical protein